MKPFEVCIDCGGFGMEVRGKYWPARAANNTGHPDTRTPAEGAELDVTCVSTTLGDVIAFNKTDFESRWADAIIDAIEEEAA
jgi:hypothetical protein